MAVFIHTHSEHYLSLYHAQHCCDSNGRVCHAWVCLWGETLMLEIMSYV